MEGLYMIYVPKDLPKKYATIFIYAVSHAMYDECVTTQEIITKIKLNNTYHNRDLVNHCIQYMLDNELVTGSKLCTNKYELFRTEVDLKSGKYYSVDYDDIDKIINIKDKCNRLDLIDYYIYLISTVNYRTKVGFTSVNTLSKKCGITAMTICRYNKILENNELIYIVKSKCQGLSNRYGRYEDRYAVLFEAKKAKLANT
jgi:hypothetical protein